MNKKTCGPTKIVEWKVKDADAIRDAYKNAENDQHKFDIMKSKIDQFTNLPYEKAQARLEAIINLDERQQLLNDKKLWISVIPHGIDENTGAQMWGTVVYQLHDTPEGRKDYLENHKNNPSTDTIFIDSEQVSLRPMAWFHYKYKTQQEAIKETINFINE